MVLSMDALAAATLKQLAKTKHKAYRRPERKVGFADR